MEDEKLRELKFQFILVHKYMPFLDELRKFHQMFEDYYGTNYADKDDDSLIDCIDYGGGMEWGAFLKHIKENY